MKKSKIDKKMVNSLLISLIVFLVILIGGTFAWLSYQSKKSALVLTIDGVNDTSVTLSPYQINSSMTPVDTYTSGVCSEVLVVNNGNNSTDVILYYKINKLDQNLIDNGLQYTITSSSTKDGTYSLVSSGDFTEAVVGEDFLILEAEAEASSQMYYKVYLWVEDLDQDQSVIQNSVLDLELYGSLSSSLGIPTFTYTGEYEIVDDNDNAITDVASYEGKWKIRFLSDGTFVSDKNILVDVFLVGGGGGGGAGSGYQGGGGGGGGYTNTQTLTIQKGNSYEIFIGDGGAAASSTNSYVGESGETTTAFDLSANGGSAGKTMVGGAGGSGGGGGGYSTSSYKTGGKGGEDGSDGLTSGQSSSVGGTGQVTTTREFGETTGTLYAGGGGGGAGFNTSTGSYGVAGTGGSGGGGNGSNPGTENTGGGGGGGITGYAGGKGGSGIVVVRNAMRTISYDANGGTGTIADTTVFHGNSAVVTYDKPTQTGYTLVGWATTADATAAEYSAGDVITLTSDVTLYAVWRLNKAYINFHVNGGTVQASTTYNSTTYSWTTVDDVIYRNSKAPFFSIEYGASKDLPNADGPTYLIVTNGSYALQSGAEWKCFEGGGCTDPTATFSDTTSYYSKAFCDTSYSDCTVTLKINWGTADSADPTCTIAAEAGSTTLTATYSDDVGVTGYYFGTTEPSSSTTFTSMTSSTSGTKTGTVSSTGTYYFGFKDATGNIGYCSKKITSAKNSCVCGYYYNGYCATGSSTITWCSDLCPSGIKLSSSYCG